MTVICLLTRHFRTISYHLPIRCFTTHNIIYDINLRRNKDFTAKMPKSRDDPVIMTLQTPEFKSIFTPELKTLVDLFKKHNYEIRIAGGAVRDLLMNKIPQDLDFATTATPDQMKEMFNHEGIRMINTNGERHGTITARINDKENFEITTLRIDVLTDGRHADIEFTTDWRLDANRRDLTINSMFLDLDGRIHDYFFGYEDLKKRRVTFVGDPATRICEDFLRIFRYFRFYGRISKDPDNHETSTIDAIRQNVAGLERISGERIWSEWCKILTGNFGIELTKKMIDCGISKYIGLPINPDIDNFNRICKRAKELQPVTMIVAMLRNENEAMALHKRLHWSAYTRDLAFFLLLHREEKIAVNPLYPYQYILLNATGKIKDTREYIVEILKYKGTPELAKQFEEWIPPKFPLNGNDLKQHVPHPKTIGKVMMMLKKIWLDGDFKATKEQLLENVPSILEELEYQLPSKRKTM